MVMVMMVMMVRTTLVEGDKITNHVNDNDDEKSDYYKMRLFTNESGYLLLR